MTKTTIALMALIAVILTRSTVYANNGVPTSIVDLESEFTGFEVFLTDLSDEVNINMIDILNLQGNQTSQQTEIDDLQNDITALQGNSTSLQSSITSVSASVSALPEVLKYTKADSNSPTCEVTPFPFAFSDWCPNSFVSSFDITDGNVTSSSAVYVSLTNSPLSVCGVTDINNGDFRVKCATGPTNGAELHYIIVN